jgi:hypothetical protein
VRAIDPAILRAAARALHSAGSGFSTQRLAEVAPREFAELARATHRGLEPGSNKTLADVRQELAEAIAGLSADRGRTAQTLLDAPDQLEAKPGTPGGRLQFEAQRIVERRGGKSRREAAIDPQGPAIGPLTPDEIEAMKRLAHRRSKGDRDANTDLMLCLIDWQVGRYFDGHGIAKVGVPQQLSFLLALLQRGIDPKRDFHTAPLELDPELKPGAGAGMGTSGGTCNHAGSFIVLAPPGQKLKPAGIRYVLVNDAYYGEPGEIDPVARLQRAFPHVEFIRADEAPRRLKEIVAGTSLR